MVTPMLTQRLAVLAALGTIVFGPLALDAQNPADWPAVAGDVGAMKYSPADQITPANVAKLTQAWTYQPGGPAPIVVSNVMYFASGANVVALNAETGTEVWKFTLADAAPGGAIRRGMTWRGRRP
jgi:glucose dehydrogenase